MRHALCFPMLAVCFIALQCTADEANKPGEQSDLVSSPDATSAPSDVIDQPAAGANTGGKHTTGAGGTGALPSGAPPPPPPPLPAPPLPAVVPPVPPVIPGSTGDGEEDKRTGAKDVVDVDKEEEERGERGEEEAVVVPKVGEDAKHPEPHGTSGGKSVGGPNAGTELAHGGTGLAGLSGHVVPDASEAGAKSGHTDQRGALGGTSPGGAGTGDVGSGGQGNTSIPGADNGGAGVPPNFPNPSGPDSLDSGKDKGKENKLSSVGTGTGGGGVGAGMGGTGIGFIHRVNSAPPTTKAGTPDGQKGTPKKDAIGHSSGNKDLSPALLKPAAKDTNTQTTEQTTSGGGQPAVKVPTSTPSTSTVAQPEQKPKASNPGEKDTTPLQTLKSNTLTSAPKDSTQASVTSTTEFAKEESTAPATSLPQLSKSLQFVDKNDGSIESFSLVAFTAVVTLFVMSVSPAF